MNSSDSSRLQVPIVTGAGQEIGRAIAHRLARDGFAVVIVDINTAKGLQNRLMNFPDYLELMCCEASRLGVTSFDISPHR